MRQLITEKATELLAELDVLGTIDNMVYALPFDDPKGGMTKTQLLAQQKRELQSGRWQAMQARHWLCMALQEKADEKALKMLMDGMEFHKEAMLRAKGKEARLAKLPDLGGRPKSEDIDILIDLVDEIRPETSTLIAAVRLAISQNPRLKMRYGESDDDYLRKIIRERRKDKNRP